MNRWQRLKLAFIYHAVQPVAVRVLVARERLESGVTYNPLDKRYRSDPYPLYRSLRERDPFHRSRLVGGWVLARYNDVAAALRDGRFLADDRKLPFQQRQREQFVKDGLLDDADEMVPALLRNDPPDHTRLRSLVSKAFTPRTVEALRPRVEAIVQEHIDSVVQRGEMDVIRDLAYPVPVIVIAEMLGIPTKEREQFKRWSDDAVRALSASSLNDFILARDAFRALRAYFEGVAEERRREPREDLLSALLVAEEAGDKLSMDEVFSICILLLVAGNETTTNLIGNGVFALLQHPDQLELLRRDPGLIESAVEEMLRYESPVQATSRFVLERVELDGHVIESGQQAIVLIGAANRDPEQFADPDRLDITRQDNRHLAFGQGIHYCLGAPLARLESQVALLALTERFPKMRLAPERHQWRDNLILRGLERLPITL